MDANNTTKKVEKTAQSESGSNSTTSVSESESETDHKTQTQDQESQNAQNDMNAIENATAVVVDNTDQVQNENDETKKMIKQESTAAECGQEEEKKEGEDHHSDEETEEEDLNLGDTSNLSTEDRNKLFQRGLDFERKKKPKLALQCYLGCIRGLKGKSSFALLPQCLHGIADIYKDQENYDEAIRFAQAEKLLYETALIETEDIQKKLEGINESDAGPQDLNELNIAAMRADEYEHLAKLCLDKDQPQLALEYAGKCTKLRQQVYGDNSEKTKASLNLFASIYAEVGKSQYSESINLLTESSSRPQMVRSSSSTEPVSILRQRSVDGEAGDSGPTDREKKQVRFHESVDESEKQKKKEEMASLTLSLIVLAICFVVLASLGAWLYCAVSRGPTCQNISQQARQWLHLVQYQLHLVTSPQKVAS